MIAHVAAAGEGRGRVVLWLGSSARTSSSAIDAAIVLARAFQSEVESLFVEDRQLFDLADFPVRPRHQHRRRLAGAAARRPRARDALHRRGAAAPGRRCRAPRLRRLPQPRGARRSAARACDGLRRQRPVERRHHRRALRPRRRGASARGLRQRSRHDGRHHRRPARAAHRGPRRRRRRAARPGRADAQGRRASGRRQRRQGAADADRRPPERARLARGRGAPPAWATTSGPTLETVLAAHGDVVPVAEAVRRHKGGFLLAQYGGQVVSEETSLRPLASALECPLLLVR